MQRANKKRWAANYHIIILPVPATVNPVLPSSTTLLKNSVYIWSSATQPNILLVQKIEHIIFLFQEAPGIHHVILFGTIMKMTSCPQLRWRNTRLTQCHKWAKLCAT